MSFEFWVEYRFIWSFHDHSSDPKFRVLYHFPPLVRNIMFPYFKYRVLCHFSQMVLKKYIYEEEKTPSELTTPKTFYEEEEHIDKHGTVWKCLWCGSFFVAGKITWRSSIMLPIWMLRMFPCAKKWYLKCIWINIGVFKKLKDEEK